METRTLAENELDLALAAELQAALLPSQCPEHCPNQQAAALNRMCGSVGGDFHDFLRLNDEQTAIVIGDCVGHGVRAALLMAQIMGLLRSRPAYASRPEKMVSELNRMLLDLGERTGSTMLCSIFYAVIDLPSGVGFFVNAGHPVPLLCDRRKCSTLRWSTRNFMLGVKEFEPLEFCHTFSPGERMVLFTDGLVDASNVEGERFGDSRLHEIIGRCVNASPNDCARSVFDEVAAFRNGSPQTDDETIVVIDRV